MKPPKSFHNRLIRHLREWHRKLGILAAFFLIFLSISGIALNHTDSLGLAHSPISNKWLLDHYGITPPNDVRFYVKNNVVVTDNLVWLSDNILLDSSSKIIGIAPVVINQMKAYAVVSFDQLYFYSQNGELIEQLGEESGFPIGAKAIAKQGENLIIKSRDGIHQYNSEEFSWQNINFIAEPNWLLPSLADEQKIAQAILKYRAQYLTLERIFLDAHSGRIFGLFGVIFMDAVAVLLILLSISGIYIWIRYARMKR